MNESDLVARATQAGDVAAFATLVRLHQSRVRAFLRRMTRADAALADDLAQETFLEAHRKLGQYRAEGAFIGWLLRIAYSRFLMEARRRKTQMEAESSEPYSAAAELDPAARLDLEKAMMRLGVNERAALTLHFALGCSHEETAAIMRLPLG